MGDLIVELYGQRVGVLTVTGAADFDFRFAPGIFERLSLGSSILSFAIPAYPVLGRREAPLRRNFFAGLLPEGDALEDLTLSAGLRSSSDVIGLLSRYGRDVAGALQIWDPANPDEPKAPHLTLLTDKEVATLLVDHQQSPLGNRTKTGKSSLPGVQDKIVLAKVGDAWNQVNDGYPSTHILKPTPKNGATTIFDEEYGSRIARRLGLANFATYLHDFAGVPTIVIERYDRDAAAPAGRIHQEDFSQVLGARGREKYEIYSAGKVTLQKVATVLTAGASADDLERLLRLNVMSVAVGNLDLHAKNLSILHLTDESMRLAPAYDVVPMVHRGFDGQMSLSVNRVFDHAAITISDLEFEARAWGMKNPVPKIAATLEEIQALANIEQPDDRAHPELAADIVRFSTNLLEKRTAGAKP